MLLLNTTLRPYALALGAVLAAIIARAMLDPLLGGELPFYVFYFAVIAAAVRGGIGPGLAALSVSFVAAAYLFAMPRFSLALEGSENVSGAFRFITLGVILVLGGNWGRTMQAKWRLEMQARRLEASHAHSVHEEALSTLASIGDGLITVDLHGKVTYMNAVAEQLSGWTSTVAQGRDISQVFRIVHATTREPVSDPVRASLREGRVVTLPPHTMLIGRNGEERPIDDSAAPIRNAQGAMLGSVLVFREVVDKRTAVQDFTVAAVELFPAPGSHLHLSASELERLEGACRAWLAGEWRPNANASRIVAIAGYNITFRQDGAETLPGGGLSLRFLAAYAR